MATPIWIKKMLQLRGISFTETHHPEVYTAQELAQREHISGHRVAKVVVVLADGKPVELILPASRRVLLDRVKEIMKAQTVRLATEEEMSQVFAEVETGAIPPLPHWKNVQVLMDNTMHVDGEILFQAGTHRDCMLLRFQDWFRVVEPRVASFTAPADR